MPVPYSYAVTTIVVATALVAVPFPYITKAHVKLEINGTLVDANTYTWSNDALIDLGAPTTVGNVVRVYRVTPAEELLTLFQAGDFDHKDLNNVHTQLLFISQEAFDEAFLAGEVARSILEYVEQITDMYNEILAIYAAILASAIKYDIIFSCPFEVFAGEYPGVWKTPSGYSFSGDFTKWALLTKGPVVANSAFVVQLVTLAGSPLADVQVLAEGTIAVGQVQGTWTTPIISGLLPFALPQGTVLGLKVISANDRMKNFSMTSQFVRTGA